MSEAPSFSYEITVSRLNGELLPDGDEIKLEYVGTTSNPSNIEFELVLKKDMWWKGLVLFAKEDKNNWEEVVAGDYKDLQKKDYKKRDVAIPFQKILDKFSCLSKAKFLGTHSNVYHVTDADTALKAGNKYRISWLKE